MTIQTLRKRVTLTRRNLRTALRRYNRAILKYIVARRDSGLRALPPKFYRGNRNK